LLILVCIEFDAVGKVHGGLSRAGKVRGQTPKVEKIAKTKPTTGRSKRRIQFNRAEENKKSTSTGGRKMGPNRMMMEKLKQEKERREAEGLPPKKDETKKAEPAKKK